MNLPYLQKLKKLWIEFEDYYIVTTCTKPYQTNKGTPKQTKEIVASKPYTKKFKEDDTWYPYMCGSTMHRFTNTWQLDGTYIKYGKWLAEPRYIESDKIIIRQSDDRLIATIDNIGVNNNTLHTITMKKDNKISLLYALCILNSELLNWYHKKENFLEDGKQQAKVKGEHVKKLPFIIGNAENVISIEKCASSLLTLCQERFNTRYKFVHYIDKKYKPKTLSKKIIYFETISFDIFVQELKKQKCQLSSNDEMNMLSLFEETISTIQSLNTKIKNVSTQLNDTVFEIYKLSSETVNVIKSELSITY